MSISTTLGDDGTTQVGSRRVSKASPEVEALGALDELVSALGFARSLTRSDRIRARTEQLQRALFGVSAGIGAPPGREAALPSGLVLEITGEVRELESGAGMLSDWALPGGHAAAAAFDLARTSCRRAERALVRLAEAAGGGDGSAGTGPGASPESLAFLNRMSDLLWLYGRVLERESGVEGALRAPPPAASLPDRDEPGG